jgi:hypothetical protein
MKVGVTMARARRAVDVQNTIRRVRYACQKLGLLPLEERYEPERKEARVRFGDPAPAVRLRKELIAARISAATVIGPTSAAVIVHLDAAEECQPFTHREHGAVA